MQNIILRCSRAGLSRALMLTVLVCVGGAAHAGMTDGVKKVVLPNGLTILVLENHKAPVSNFNVIYRVGSRNEQMGKTGVSHLVEHLMFRGTKKLKPEEFSNIIQENGGEDNAFTEEDLTAYFELINRDHLDVPIALEADRMANFEPKGFDSEKAVVIEERRMRTEDNPQDALAEVTQAQAYVAHPYHWPVIGWMHDVQGLTLQDTLDYHRIYYSPQNALIVAVGDFKADDVIKQITETFSAISNGPKPPPVTAQEPPQEGARGAMLKHAAQLPAFGEAFHVPAHESPDCFALELASVIMSGGKSSRFYKKLVIEKRMVVDIDASYDLLSFDPTLFWVTAQMRPSVKADDVINVVDGEIKQLASKPVDPQELQKAKNQELAEFVFSQDSIFREAMMLGQYELIGGYKQLDQYIPSIDKVTPADVQRVVAKYLVTSNRTLGTLVPTGLLPHPGGGLGGGAVRHAPWGMPS
ncbi:MAG TPA: pitrilysin family protein [Candidatus Binataceae bacterium]|nr:pitrilysin family protein [Candidatus Binataceae bacterium]